MVYRFLLDGTKGKQDDEMNELLEPWINLISSLSHSYRDCELAICLHITNDADLETVEKLVGLLPRSMIVNVVCERTGVSFNLAKTRVNWVANTGFDCIYHFTADINKVRTVKYPNANHLLLLGLVEFLPPSFSIPNSRNLSSKMKMILSVLLFSHTSI